MITYPSPNYWLAASLPRSEVKALCYHGTASKGAASALGWLTNRKSGVSANYLISKAGTVYQLVDPATKRAWANGIPDIFDSSVKWLADCIANGDNPNWYTISLEHEATKEDMQFHASMPDPQFNASIDLSARLLKQFGLKANHETMIAHCQIAAKAKATCPGVIFIPAYQEVLINRYPELRG